MNGNQIDQFFFRLNYQSRYTLASPRPNQTTSPLLSSNYKNSIYRNRYMQTSRYRRKSQQKCSVQKKPNNNITIEQGDCILIEEPEDAQFQITQDQQLQRSQEQIRSFQLVSKHENEKSWIKIQQEFEQQINSFFTQKIVYQGQDYQQSNKKQSKIEEVVSSPSQNKSKLKQQFVETGLNLFQESEESPNMTRNYTFGNNLNQITFFQVLNHCREKHQRRHQQGHFSNNLLQSSSQRKKPQFISLSLQQFDNGDGHQDINQIISPKFADLPLSQTNMLETDTQFYQKKQKRQCENEIQTPKSKRQQLNTYRKEVHKDISSNSSSGKVSSKSKKTGLKQSQICVKEHNQLQKEAILIKQSQSQNSQQKQEKSKEIQSVNIFQPYQQSIDKIERILDCLPSKLKNTYQNIIEQLLVKQSKAKQQMQLQAQKIKVLSNLIQLLKKGLEVQTFILQPDHTFQEKITLNQIILRLAIKQLVKKNKFFHLKEQI